jgi:hypothetical protein
MRRPILVLALAALGLCACHAYETLQACAVQRSCWNAPEAITYFGKDTRISDVQCYPSDFDPRGKDRTALRYLQNPSLGGTP